MAAVLANLATMATAVRTAEGDWSGAELLRHARSASRLLSAAGPRDGVVPALVGSSPTSIALILGGAFCGRPLAPLGTRLAVAELVPLVTGLGAPVLVADPPNAALARETAAGAGVELLVVGDLEPNRAAERDRTSDLVSTSPESVVLVLHTSGTTGRPKVVRVRDNAMFHRAMAYRAAMGLRGGDLYCSTGGFHHTGGAGMAFVALACGAGIVPFPRFSVDAWRDVAALSPTAALLVPTMIDLLLEEEALRAVPLRALQYGTAPIHPETLRAALAALPDTEFTQAYGMTEGGPITLMTHADHLRALDGNTHLLASVGGFVPGLEHRLVDVGEDGVGELVVRAPQIFQPDPDGWLSTGDLGRVDAEGFLYLRGRRGDKIIRGGENVYPLEVERVLELHPGVREAAVIGVENRRWGQTIKAVVVPADPEVPPSPAALAEHARARLASFKVPSEWQFTDELPRNAAGKLLRRQLT